MGAAQAAHSLQTAARSCGSRLHGHMRAMNVSRGPGSAGGARCRSRPRSAPGPGPPPPSDGRRARRARSGTTHCPPATPEAACPGNTGIRRQCHRARTRRCAGKRRGRALGRGWQQSAFLGRYPDSTTRGLLTRPSGTMGPPEALVGRTAYQAILQDFGVMRGHVDHRTLRSPLQEMLQRTRKECNTICARDNPPSGPVARTQPWTPSFTTCCPPLSPGGPHPLETAGRTPGRLHSPVVPSRTRTGIKRVSHPFKGQHSCVCRDVLGRSGAKGGDLPDQYPGFLGEKPPTQNRPSLMGHGGTVGHHPSTHQKHLRTLSVTYSPQSQRNFIPSPEYNCKGANGRFRRGGAVNSVLLPHIHSSTDQKGKKFPNRTRGMVFGGGGGWHEAMVLVCLPLAAPIGLWPLYIPTLCGSKRVLVVPTEPLDDLSCLTTPGSAVPESGCCLWWSGGGGLDHPPTQDFRSPPPPTVHRAHPCLCAAIKRTQTNFGIILSQDLQYNLLDQFQGFVAEFFGDGAGLCCSSEGNHTTPHRTARYPTTPHPWSPRGRPW